MVEIFNYIGLGIGGTIFAIIRKTSDKIPNKTGEKELFSTKNIATKLAGKYIEREIMLVRLFGRGKLELFRLPVNILVLTKIGFLY